LRRRGVYGRFCRVAVRRRWHCSSGGKLNVRHIHGKEATYVAIEASKRNPIRVARPRDGVLTDCSGYGSRAALMPAVDYPSLRSACLRSAYAADNPIAIKIRMPSERDGWSGSPLRHSSISCCQASNVTRFESAGPRDGVPADRAPVPQAPRLCRQLTTLLCAPPACAPHTRRTIQTRSKFGWRRNGMGGQAPRCAIHQFPVATPAQAEN
jgi:hypothetical protein